MKIKRLLAILVAFILVSCTSNKVTVVETTTPKLEGLQIVDIEKYGNIVLPITATELFSRGFDYEDIVTVSFLDKKMDMPICDTYFDVDNGECLLLAEINKEINSNKTTIAISMGDFATTNKIAEKELTNDETGYKWNYLNDNDKRCTFTIELKEKGGYHEGHLVHNLVRSNNRVDYKNLTDEEFANFRMIKTSGMGDNKVYRSSSPLSPEINRNIYAMIATEKYGIKTILNLADSEKEMEAWEAYKDSYYSKQKVIPACLALDFTTDSFKEGFKDVIHFMAENEAPYLIHCTEGKDRAGYLSAIVECLMGASIDEVINDYMLTYYNYYNVLPGSDQYNLIRDKRILNQLFTAFGTENLANADLSKLCEEYLLSIGVTEEDIVTLKSKLQ